SLVMSLGEAAAGYNIARVNDLGGGEAAAIGSAGNFGLGIGLAASQIADEDAELISRSGAAWGLGVSALGYVAGAMLTRDARYTKGDADVLNAGGLLGAALPVSALYFAGERDTKPVMSAGIAGAIAGIALGHLFLRERDFSSAQGNFVYLSTVSGGLVGAGLGYAFGPEEDGDRVVALTAAAGAALGFGLMVAGVSEEAGASWRSSAWRVSISPAGFAAASLPGMETLRAPIPFLHITASF
ncbi:MAG: hypothetical protein IPP94_17325, partial [Ignavibacteria bacterium]|nr:hypothetical protein [Ignavibacteria bacterium]